MNVASKDLHFVTPPGIGDTWWVYQKLHSLIGKRDVSIELCVDPPLRTEPFGVLLPGITSIGYGTRRYGGILPRLLKPDVDISRLASGTYCISCNPYLEAGMSLDAMWSNQATGYHLPLHFHPSDGFQANETLAKAPTKKMIGFYCSSTRHGPDDLFWTVSEWVHFLRHVADCAPDASFVSIGTTWDDKTESVFKALKAVRNFPVVDGMHKPLSVTLSIIKQLSYFFAYPSGLGIMADNFKVPSMMWYWSNRHPKFPGTYTSPESKRLGRHVIEKFSDVSKGIEVFESQGLKWLK